jgi:hypothetical protein
LYKLLGKVITRSEALAHPNPIRLSLC